MYSGECIISCLLLALLLILFVLQHRRHLALRQRLRSAVLVNGTRGKSSTTRLIAAGLRAAYPAKVLGKTTGTSARWLMPDGSDNRIARFGAVNIREMAAGLALAEKIGADIYVAECMAVRTEYQAIVQRRWLRADITVMTNVRPDHEDSVGPGLRATAESLAASLPRHEHGGVLVAHEETVAVLESVCAFPRERVVLADPTLGQAWLGLFTEPVVPENLSLALTVCQQLGVPPEVAAPAMATALTDPGNLELRDIVIEGRPLSFVGAFAANDPQSTLQLAEQYASPPGYTRGLWLHGRADRRPRSKALCQALRALKPDFILLSGDVDFLRRQWMDVLCPVFSLALRSDDEVRAALATLPPGPIWLLAAGNTKGMVPQNMGGDVLCRNLSLA